MSTTTSIIFSTILFDVLTIWFIHKVSVRFHKMDKKVGNIEGAEHDSSNRSILTDNISHEKKENEEEEIKENQEIYQ